MSKMMTAALVLLIGAEGVADEAVPVEAPQHIEAIGQTRVRLMRAADRLCAPPLDDIRFVLADVSLQMTRRFTNYSGDISGRLLGALNAADPILGRTSPMVARLVAKFPEYQKPDGHFGAKQDLDKLVQIRDMPILWGNGRLLLALAERCRWSSKAATASVRTRPSCPCRADLQAVPTFCSTSTESIRLLSPLWRQPPRRRAIPARSSRWNSPLTERVTST